MQVGQGSVPLRLSFDPSTLKGASLTPQQQLKRLLISQSSQEAFQETRRILTGGARQRAVTPPRTSFYQDVRDRLDQTQKDLATPRTLKSANGLRLGSGDGNPVVPIDLFRPLSTQSFAVPVVDGSVGFSLRVNGGGPTAANVGIAPGTDTLDTVLNRFNSIAVGGQTPISATVQNDRLSFKVSSGATTQFDVDITGDATLFFEAFGSGGRETDILADATAAVQAGAGTLAYNDLQITYQGATVNFTGLSVSGAGLSANQRALELADQLNDKLAGSNLVATGVNGKLSFGARDTQAVANPDLGIGIQELAVGGAKTLGLLGGFTASATITATAALSGPDATLAALADRLGLKAVDGGFKVAVGSTTLTFKDSQTLSEVLKQIGASEAGVEARFDDAENRVSLTQRQAALGGINAKDLSGNLLAGLGLTPEDSGFSVQLAKDLRDVGGSLNETLALIDAATANGGPFRNDALLRDLSDALRGLFTKRSDASGAVALGDLGLTRANNQVSFDQAQLDGFLANQGEGGVSRVQEFLSKQVSPLLNAGKRALEDDLARAPFDQRLAEQSVHVRGEIARLQSRQQLLLQHQVTFESQQDQLREQRRKLSSQDIEVPPESGNPARHQPEPVPEPKTRETPSPSASTTKSPGVLSFGMSE